MRRKRQARPVLDLRSRNFTPPSLNSLGRLLVTGDGADEAARRDNALARCSVAATLAGNHVPHRFVVDVLTPEEREGLNEQDLAAEPTCRYCRVRQHWTNAHADIGALNPAPTRPRDRETHAAPDIDFDPDTFTTRVLIERHRRRLKREVARRLLRVADPPHWQEAAPDFFVQTRPGDWKAGLWQDRDWSLTDRGSGDLYEYTRWNWSASVPAETHNILSISNRRRTDTSLSFDYALRHCITTRLGLAWEYGGLDIDNGRYEAHIEGDGVEVMLEVTAEKSVRYTPPQTSPAELAAFLNTMAPALVTALLRQLVYQGPEVAAGQLVAENRRGSGPAE